MARKSGADESSADGGAGVTAGVGAGGDDGEGTSTQGGATTGEPVTGRTRPEALSLLLEFVKMSRTSAILLIVFLLTGALYLVVREEPVVAFRSPQNPDTSQTGEAGPTSEESSGTTASDQSTGVTTPPLSSSPSPSPSPSPTGAEPGTDGDTDTETTDTSVPARRPGADGGPAATEPAPTGGDQAPATPIPDAQATGTGVPGA